MTLGRIRFRLTASGSLLLRAALEPVLTSGQQRWILVTRKIPGLESRICSLVQYLKNTSRLSLPTDAGLRIAPVHLGPQRYSFNRFPGRAASGQLATVGILCGRRTGRISST